MASTRRCLVFALLLGLSLVAAAPARAQFSDPYKLIDITSYVGQPFPGSDAQRYIEYNGEVYFFAAGGLWKTNGTREGTSFIADFSAISDMAVVNGQLLIAGSVVGDGFELWRSNGTFSGTVKVKDIYPGTLGSNPSRFFVWGSLLLFSADPDGLGPVLHVSDGTFGGTTALATYKAPQEYIAFNGRVFFTAKVDQLPATETNLWSWSPATGGQLVESRVVADLAVVGTTLFMTKRSGSLVAGRVEGELWKTDGTPLAATRVTTLWTGGDAAVSRTTALGTTVFFAGCDPAAGRGLYKTDGTTVTLVKDFLVYLDGTPVLSPANSCDPTNGPDQLTVINGVLYFEVDDGDRGRELWKSDGTTGGTVMVADINGGVEPSDLLLNADSCGRASCRAVTAGGFFFTARDDWEGREVWFSDGTSATRLTAVEAGSNDGVPSPRILLFSNKLYFTGNDEDFNREPWVLPLTPTLSIADVSVSEGSPQATVTVHLLPANPLAPVTVNWATVNGSAGSPGDFTASLGTLTFPPNSTIQTLSVPIQNDATSESDESFSVRLSAEAGAQVVNRQNEVTIHDDDGLQLSVSGPLVDPNEGSSATFTISLTAPHDTFVSVYYHTVAGTAGAADFTPTVGWVQFDPTTSTTPQTKTVSVSTTADTMFEDNWETLELEIFEPSGASIANSRATAWIWDNDVEPTAQIGDKTVAEDNTFATFAVSLTRPSGRTVRLFWSADGGGANPTEPGVDFRDAAGFVVFRPGETTHDVTLEVFEDIVDEPNETAYVDLDTVNAVNTVVTNGRGVGTITDDDTGTITINDVTVVEGDVGPVVATLTLTLNVPYYKDFTVDYTTQDATALAANSDYTPKSGTLSFPKGTTSQTLTVNALGDLIDESSETFRVFLSASTGPGFSSGGNLGIVTITDDDTTVSVAPASVNEVNTGATSTITFTVSTLEVYKTDFTVDYATVVGGVQPATPGADYVATSGTLLFPQGTKTKTFTVTANGDVIDEPAETFLVRLSNSSGPLILTGEAIGTINDNDTATLSINNVTVPEGNSATSDAVFTLTLTTPYYRDFTVDWATAAGTTNPATEGQDYIAGSGIVTFLAGTTSQTVNVAVVGDLVTEPNETFAVVLSNSTGPPNISDSRGDATITNDDILTVDVADVSVVEGNSGQTPATFTVTLGAEHQGTVTVQVSTTSGGPTPPAATAGTDYVTLPVTTLTFAPGVMSQTVSVSVIGDAVAEASNESFGLTLANPTGGAVLGRTRALGIILDDDSSRTIAMSPLTVSVMEPLSTTVNARFTATLSADAGQTITVSYATANGTALAGSDYTATTGTLSFGPGQRTQTIDVPVLSDSLVEGPETFTLTLSAPTNGTIATGAGTATATISDSLSQVAMGFYTVTPCRVVDTRSPAPGSPLAGGVTRTFPVLGNCGIPLTARVISFNITVTAASSNGNVRLFPGGTPAPTTSTVNFTAGVTRANNGIVALGTDGDVAALLAPAGTAHLIIDVNGYME